MIEIEQNKRKGTDVPATKESQLFSSPTQDNLTDSVIYEELQKKMILAFAGSAVSLIAAFIALILRIPNPFGIFALLCFALCGYYGSRFINPMKQRSYRAIPSECTDKESYGARRQYCKYYFDSEDAGAFMIHSSDKHKYVKEKQYVMVFIGKEAPLTGQNLLLSIPVHSKKISK